AVPVEIADKVPPVCGPAGDLSAPPGIGERGSVRTVDDEPLGVVAKKGDVVLAVPVEVADVMRQTRLSDRLSELQRARAEHSYDGVGNGFACESGDDRFNGRQCGPRIVVQ